MLSEVDVNGDDVNDIPQEIKIVPDLQFVPESNGAEEQRAFWLKQLASAGCPSWLEDPLARMLEPHEMAMMPELSQHVRFFIITTDAAGDQQHVASS